MATVDATYWRDRVRDDFIPQIGAFERCLLKRVLPGFETISEEADEVQKEAYEKLGPGHEDSDYHAALDAAWEKSLAFYVLTDGVRQGVINLFAAGLYHAFEQQLLIFCRRGLLGPRAHPDPTKAEQAIPVLAAVGLDPNHFTSWKRIFEEMRHIANVVKHAEGHSERELRKLRPDLFQNPDLGGPAAALRGRLPVDQPLMGDGIYVTVDEISSQVKCLIAFWDELAERLETLNLPSKAALASEQSRDS